MFVSDIINEAKDVIGKCSDAITFRRITDAVRLANNQAAGNDWNVGLMELCVCDGCVTLPADVGTILAVNNGGQPTLVRDQWYQFHINGSGNECNIPCGYTDELGPVSTYRDPDGPVQLVAISESPQDTNAVIRAFGWDENGKRIYTTNSDGLLQDGFIVPCIYGFTVPNPEASPVARIDRIQKAVTNGFVKLIAIDPTTQEAQTQIGYYQPWETNPSYRRLRVPDRSWIKIKYRRKDLEVRGTTDWINIDNREAILLLLKAVQSRLNNQIEQAMAFEKEGMRILSNEANALRPPGVNAPQIFMVDTPFGATDTLFY